MLLRFNVLRSNVPDPFHGPVRIENRFAFYPTIISQFLHTYLPTRVILFPAKSLGPML